MPSADLDTAHTFVTGKLTSDDRWQVFAGDGSIWVCPCCGTLVDAGTAPPAELLGLIIDHLAWHCPTWQDNPDGQLDLASLEQLRLAADTAFRLQRDPAWQVRSGDGRWICPGSLTAIDAGTDLTSTITIPRQTCAELQASAGKLPGAVITARDQFDQANQIGTPVDMPGPDLWYEAPEVATGPDVEEMERDLAEAKELQLNLMRNAPTVSGFDIATHYRACAEVSGDFNQFVNLDNDLVGIAQGDVSGHGVRAGMFMAIANKLVELYGPVYPDPRQTIIQVHRAMVDDLDGKNFVTMAYGILDPAERTFAWVRAGHNPAMIWRAALGKVECVQPKGIAVGLPVYEAFANALEVETTRLGPGDLLLIYTDGLSETRNPAGEQFNDNGVAEVLATAAAAGDNAEAVVKAIVTAATAFRASAVQEDDVSLIAIGSC